MITRLTSFNTRHLWGFTKSFKMGTFCLFGNPTWPWHPCGRPIRTRLIRLCPLPSTKWNTANTSLLWKEAPHLVNNHQNKEQYEFKNGGGEITPKIITLLKTAHTLGGENHRYFDNFYHTLKKYLNVEGIFGGSEGKHIAATLWLIVREGGGFNDYSLMNLLHDPLPVMHYYTVDFYAADYDSEEIK